MAGVPGRGGSRQRDTPERPGRLKAMLWVRCLAMGGYPSNAQRTGQIISDPRSPLHTAAETDGALTLPGRHNWDSTERPPLPRSAGLVDSVEDQPREQPYA